MRKFFVGLTLVLGVMSISYGAFANQPTDLGKGTFTSLQVSNEKSQTMIGQGIKGMGVGLPVGQGTNNKK